MATKTRAGGRDARDDQPSAGLTVGQLRDLVRDVVRSELEALDARERPALIDATALAKHLGVTTRSVSNLRGKGLPTTMVMQAPRFDLAAVLAWLGEGPSEHLEHGPSGWMRKLAGGRSRPATPAELERVRAKLAPLVAAKLGR